MPSQFKEVEDVKLLTDEEVASFGKIDSTNGVYLQFTQTLTAGKKFRLLSADAAEELVGYKGRDVIKIEKGDDDFFYATSERDCNFTYVIKAQRQTSLDLPSDHPIRKIIDSYKNGIAGERKITEKYEAENHCQWLENRFNQRDGSCRHKVAAVEYQLQKADGVDQQDFRVVGINNNHVVLEIKCKDRWVQVDVGGGTNYTKKDAPEGEVYQSEMVVPKPVIVKEEAKDLQYLLEEISNSDQESTATASDNSEVDSDFEVEPRMKKDNVAQKVMPDKEEVERKLMRDEENETRRVRTEETRKLKQAKDAALKATLQKLIAVFDFPKIADQEDLRSQTSDNLEKNKILIVSKDIKNHANFLLNEARESLRPSFYIDGPNAIDLNQLGVFIGNDETKNPTLRKKGLLADFLENAKNHPEQRPLLIIDWQSLSSKKRLALNTVLDEARAIGGEKIDDSIQIIGLFDSIPKDPSFLSRHDLRVVSQVEFQEAKKSIASDPALIDLEGFPDWRRQLFGRVILEGDKMIWEKSQFVEAVNAGQNVFEIANLSSQAAAELKYQFEKAKAAGEFIYYGHKIPLTQDLEIKCANESFNFVRFSEESRIAVASNVTFNQVPQDFTTINSHLFDRLLCDKEITAKGEYLERNGLIDQCTESADKTLKLFISSNLSDSQWYCLFNQALEKDVKLELCLAPKIDLPKQVKAATLNQEVQNRTSTACKIFVSNDPDQALQLIPEQYAIIDVEDFTYQDLVEKISFTVDENGFKNFTKTPSDILTNLREGKKITLKGQFSPDLLQMLEPLLIGEEPEFAGLNQNLTLIIEDEKCLEGKVYAPLQWLAKSDYEVKNYQAVEKPTQTKFAYLESWKSSDDLQNSAGEAVEFMDERKKKLLPALKANS